MDAAMAAGSPRLIDLSHDRLRAEALPGPLGIEPRRAAPQRWVVRYRGFVLIPQDNLTWLVRPERSPMDVLPFRAPASSLADVKALVDWRLEGVQAA